MFSDEAAPYIELLVDCGDKLAEVVGHLLAMLEEEQELPEAELVRQGILAWHNIARGVREAAQDR